MILPTPSDFGLPARYDKWRQYQDTGFIAAAESDKHYIAFNAPTGFGKSLVAEALCMLWGARTAYLVVDRALQTQLVDPMRGFDHRYKIQGKQNYDCRLLLEHDVDPRYAKCDQAEALCEGCQYRDKGCHYFDAVREAKARDHILPNYSMWFAMNRYSADGQGLGDFNALVCDEAHDAAKSLCSALRIELSERYVEQFTRRPLPNSQSLDLWREWAANCCRPLQLRLDALKQQAQTSGRAPKELKELRSLVSGLEQLSAASDDWVEDRSELQYKGYLGFEPKWPKKYAADLLFRGIPHVLLMSATLTRKHLTDLGLNLDDVEYLEFPSSFPVVRRPITHIKTVQHRASMTHYSKIEAVRKLDLIISGRIDRKGLVDTVSFDRSNFIGEYSQWRHLMIRNSPGRDGLSAADAIEQLKRATPPKVLVGPSFRTGYDLPMTDCEYAVLFKVPFMDGRNPLTEARRRDDPLWEKMEVMIQIIQFFGRAMRSDIDSCEGFVLDDMFVWFYYECLQLGYVAKWFAPAVRLNCEVIPKPLPKL